MEKTTTCTHEVRTSVIHIEPLNDETRVPYKVCSLDIEASSSHGDFPVPIKSYKKLATNIVDVFIKRPDSELIPDKCKTLLRAIIKTAFNQSETPVPNVDLVYPKKCLLPEEIEVRTEAWLQTKVRDRDTGDTEAHLIESMFENANKALQVVKEAEAEEDGDGDVDDNASDASLDLEPAEETPIFKIGSGFKPDSYKNKQSTIVDIMCDKKFEREGKINELIISLSSHFPKLEGDKVTFIGSTFVHYGEKEPYLNHCIVLNTCDTLESVVPNSTIETSKTE
jgi:hypothetical protein